MGKNKGKAQNGRAKQKQKAQAGGAPRTTPRSRDNRLQQMLDDDDWGDDSPVRFRGFTQSGPSHLATPRNPNAKLRHHAISFVSAGTSMPTPDLRPRSDDDEQDTDGDIGPDESDQDEQLYGEEEEDTPIQTNIVLDADIESSEQGVANMTLHTNGSAMPTASQEPLPFIVDTVGDLSLSNASDLGYNKAAARAPSPAPSDSSDEVILFHGRNNKATIVNDPVAASRGMSHSQTPKLSASAVRTPPTSSVPSAALSHGWGSQPSKFDTTQQDGSNWTPAPAVPYWKKGKGKVASTPDPALSTADNNASGNAQAIASRGQSAVVADAEELNDAEKVVEALQADWKKAIREKRKLKKKEADLKTLLGDFATTSSRRKRSGRKRDNGGLRNAAISDDGDSEAAYDDYMENMRAQLDGNDDDLDDHDALVASLKTSVQANGFAGPSLVVDGIEIADDEVLSKVLKKGGVERGSIEPDTTSDWESDESKLNPDFDELSGKESLNTSDLAVELEYTERQQWEDEDDLRQRRIDRMDDEQIARLLAKQQELGIAGDELLIDDGTYVSTSDDGFGDVQAARAGMAVLSTSDRKVSSHGMRRRGDRKNYFPDASALADTLDQYGDSGFDIMDYDRPSLRPTKKGRQAPLPSAVEMLSDEELREGLKVQWDKDRSKKRQKKLEREELRAEGLLGSAGRKGKADLKVKYPLGMSMQNIHTELQTFLLDEEMRERAFPPMDKANRKALHEIAVALNLTSKSKSTGHNRFPIVYKTSLTGEYSHETFTRIVQASSRGFFSHGKAMKMAKKGPVKGGRGGGVQAATIRNGEVVGAGAAEIGQESFGHRLMLKMGWSQGKALGKDGEGLLVPVEQRMRIGTAGLG